MDVRGCVALVTGSNRGIGREFVEQLVARGAAKVYAAARRADALGTGAGGRPQIVPVPLDVTDPIAVATLASRCPDVQLLVNNAGINRHEGLIAAPDLRAAEAEMATNYFGPLRCCRAFAPVLKATDGGAIINMISLLGRVTAPAAGSLCASKAAALSLTHSVRAELAAQGTHVLAVLPGVADTDMERDYPGPKTPPAEIVAAALDALGRGDEEIYPGQMAQEVAHGLATDPASVQRQFAQLLP